METIKVKIVKGKENPLCWYKYLAGTAQDVVDHSKNMYGLFMQTPGGGKSFGTILKSDCIVLKPCYKSDGTPETGNRIISALNAKNADIGKDGRMKDHYYHATQDGHLVYCHVIPDDYYLAELPKEDDGCGMCLNGCNLCFMGAFHKRISELSNERQLRQAHIESLLSKRDSLKKELEATENELKNM